MVSDGSPIQNVDSEYIIGYENQLKATTASFLNIGLEYRYKLKEYKGLFSKVNAKFSYSIPISEPELDITLTQKKLVLPINGSNVANIATGFESSIEYESRTIFNLSTALLHDFYSFNFDLSANFISESYLVKVDKGLSKHFSNFGGRYVELSPIHYKKRFSLTETELFLEAKMNLVYGFYWNIFLGYGIGDDVSSFRTKTSIQYDLPLLHF